MKLPASRTHLSDMSNLPEFCARIKDYKVKGCIPVIAEIKCYTPSAGDLLKNRSMETIAHAYDVGGAACLSVVTGKWFKGNPGMLNELNGYTTLPILRKDFITNKQHIVQSKTSGAAAVLLTKKLLTTKHLIELSDYALSMNIAPFIEVTDKTELHHLHLPQGAIIAVNNKQILNQETDCADIEKSLILLDACRDTGAGILVSASGICLPEQTQRLFKAGYDAFLIGTALLQSDNIQTSLAQFSFLKTKKGEKNDIERKN